MPNPFTKALDTLSGKTVVNNMANPNSAAAKMAVSVGKPNPRNPYKKFVSTLPKNQKVFGVGVGM